MTAASAEAAEAKAAAAAAAGLQALQHDKEVLETQLEEVSNVCGRLLVWSVGGGWRQLEEVSNECGRLQVCGV